MFLQYVAFIIFPVRADLAIQYKYYFRFVIQGTALVHIYLDGTVFLATGSMELGQGLNTKMIQVRFTKRFPHLMKNECQFLLYLLSCCFNENS